MALAVRYITTRQPRCFLLENVDTLKTRFEEVYADLVGQLRGAGYTIRDKILNTAEHGVPHHRRRVYIAGIRNQFVLKERRFGFPKRLRHSLSVDDILEAPGTAVEVSPHQSKGQQDRLQDAYAQMRNKGFDPELTNAFVDIDATKDFMYWTTSPMMCLTKARGTTGYFVTSRGRRLAVSEMLRFQGFRPETVGWQAAKLGRTVVGQACGNAMSCNSLERVLPRLAYCAGLVQCKPRDKWEDPTFNPFQR